MLPSLTSETEGRAKQGVDIGVSQINYRSTFLLNPLNLIKNKNFRACLKQFHTAPEYLNDVLWDADRRNSDPNYPINKTWIYLQLINSN